MSTDIITVPKDAWTLISTVSGGFQSIAHQTFYSFESSSVPTAITAPIKRLALKSGTTPYNFIAGSGDLYIYSPGLDIFIQFDEQTTPASVVIGSGSDEWSEVGSITVVNAISLGGHKESEMAALEPGSFLKFASLAGAMFAMMRWRLGGQSESMTVKLYSSKPENGAFERVYDERATIAIATGPSALAAERGGFFADAAVVTGDETLKGIAEKGTLIEVDEWDTFTEDEFYVVCTIAPTSTGDLDKSSA